MLQQWANEGEFYTGRFCIATSLSRLRLFIARFIFALNKKKYHIGWIFRYTYKHLEHDIQPEIYMYSKIHAIEQARGSPSSQLHALAKYRISSNSLRPPNRPRPRIDRALE